MSPVITLFCEGTRESLDYRVIEMMLNPSGANLIPANGKHGLAAFMDGYSATSRVTDRNYFRAFRDRDFDYVVPSAVSLIRDGKYLVAYRTMIENYLLNPQNLFEYIQTSGSPEARSRISSLSSASDLFKEAFKTLRFYTAARWAHGTTKKQNSQIFGFKSNWPFDSGKVPGDIDDSSCRILMSGVISDIKDKAAQLDFGAFEQEYSVFLTKFDSTFLQDVDQCLIWFNGKDIETVIYRLLGGSNFFLNGKPGDYYDFVLNPSRFRIENFPDLVELRDILNGTIPL